MDMDFYWVIVVVCVVAGIKVNLGAQIMNKWQYFYARERSSRYLFQPSLVITLCDRVDIPRDI